MGKLRLVLMVLAASLIVQSTISTELSAQDQTSKSLIVANNTEIYSVQDKKFVAFSDILSTLEQHFDVTFLYKNEIVANKYVDINEIDIGEKTGEDLYKVIDQLNLSYSRVDKETYVLVEKHSTVKEEVILEEISGTVIDAESGETLPGVNVAVKGTTTGAATDANGEFNLNVPSLQDTLLFSFIGYQTQEVPINGQTEIHVEMQPQAIAGQEVIVVGYGTQQKQNVTGAISSVSSQQLEKVNTVNTSELLQGQLSGVHTKQTSGQPGDDDVNINIRGFGNPLIIVDGVERNLGDLDPESIESISVLKDASAAVYGARAGNGVVLVTTKRGGFEQDIQIGYDASYSAQEFTNKPRIITDAGTYLEMWTEAEANVGLTPTYSEEEIQNYKNGEQGYESYDWYDFAIKRFAPRHKQNLTLSGGGENISYYTNVGYSNQGGVIASDDWYYKRYNLRANLDGQISEFLTASLDLNFVNETQSEASDDIWRGIYKSQPMAPTSFAGSDLFPASNLVGTHQRLVGSMNKDIQGGWTRGRDKIYGKIELAYDVPQVAGLAASAKLNFQRFNYRYKLITRQWEMYNQDPATGELTLSGTFPGSVQNNLLELQHNSFSRLQPSIDVEFKRDFEKHSINALLVAEYIEDYENNMSAETQNLLSDQLEYLFLGDPTYHALDQFVEEASRGSVVGRLQYAFDDKYLLESTFRYDGSSMFPPEGRWGFFPSISLGWRLSEESFIQISNLDELKIRASYSKMGFDANAIPYDYFAGYSVNSTPPYIIGDQAYRRIQRGTLPNNLMTWEDMDAYNVGFDFSLWQGKLSGVVDGFYRKRSNILTTPVADIPSTFGAELPQQNLNSLDNRGFEFELTHNNHAGDFNYGITTNVTYSKAKWIHHEEQNYETEDERRIFAQSGQWLNRTIGYVSDGLFRSQEEIDNHSVDQDQSGNSTLLPGDIRYNDLNGDGVIDFRDQTEIGYGRGIPGLNFGLNLRTGYKNFNLSVLMQGASMYAGYISGFTQVPFRNASTPIEVHRDERFHPEKNPDGTLPLLSMGERENNTKFSDFWLKDITYLRLKNVNLSYSLPGELLADLGITRLRTYVTATNLLTLDNLGIWSNSFDPEAGMGHVGYPPHRTYTLGVEIAF